MSLEWENLVTEDFSKTDRLKVFGGWIVRDQIMNGINNDLSTTFIPDPDHEWKPEYFR